MEEVPYQSTQSKHENMAGPSNSRSPGGGQRELELNGFGSEWEVVVGGRESEDND